MKLKFSKFERVAGLFVLIALVGSIGATVGIAVQKGWFASKVKFYTVLENADGVHKGTAVQVAGLRAGSVTEVRLVSSDRIEVEFQIFKKYHSKIKKDSQLHVIRPFIIGEKVFELSIGSVESERIDENSMIITQNSFDLMDLFSGRKLGPFIGTIDSLVVNLKILLDAFSDEERMRGFVKMFDKLSPLVTNLNTMSKRVVTVTDVALRKKRLERMLISLTSITEELNVVVPQMVEAAPNLGRDIPQLVSNLNELTEQFKLLTPAITAIAPELPQASRRALEALDETVITLKALQKSFILSGGVKAVKKEEAKRKQQQERAPAGSSK